MRAILAIALPFQQPALSRFEVEHFARRLLARSLETDRGDGGTRYLVFFTSSGMLGMTPANSLLAHRTGRLDPHSIVGVYDARATVEQIVDDVASMRRCA